MMNYVCATRPYESTLCLVTAQAAGTDRVCVCVCERERERERERDFMSSARTPVHFMGAGGGGGEKIFFFY